MPANDVRAQLLRLILPTFGGAPIFPVTIIARTATGSENRWVFGRDELAALGGLPAAAEEPPNNTLSVNGDDAPLRRIHRKLLEKAGADPIPVKKLIALAGYEPNTYGREAVTYLCRLGYLERTPDGVRRGARAE